MSQSILRSGSTAFWRIWTRQAQLERRISAHPLRYTFATQMLRRGVMIDALSRYLEHSSVSITLDLYCHNKLSDDEIYQHIAEIL